MQLRAEQLDAHLKGTLAPLYVLHGDEPLLVIEAADAIRAAARTRGFSEREVLVVTQYFKWSALAEAAGNMSLFGGDKLIDLRIPTGKPGREGSDALARYAANPPAGTITLVTLPLMDWKAKKSSWFAALIESGMELELNAPGLARLPAWRPSRPSAAERDTGSAGIHGRPRRGQSAGGQPGSDEARAAASAGRTDAGAGAQRGDGRCPLRRR
jgi:DNA polymerase-3 subunit delta